MVTKIFSEMYEFIYLFIPVSNWRIPETSTWKKIKKHPKTEETLAGNCSASAICTKSHPPRNSKDLIRGKEKLGVSSAEMLLRRCFLGRMSWTFGGEKTTGDLYTSCGKSWYKLQGVRVEPPWIGGVSIFHQKPGLPGQLMPSHDLTWNFDPFSSEIAVSTACMAIHMKGQITRRGSAHPWELAQRVWRDSREPSRSKAQKEGSSRGGGGSSARDTGVLRTVHWHEPRMPDIRASDTTAACAFFQWTWKSRLDVDYDSYVNHQRHRIQALALAPLVLPKAGAAPLVLPKAGAAPFGSYQRPGAAPLVLPKAARKTRPSRGGPNSKLQTGATGPKHRLKTRAALKSPNLEVLNRKASQSKKKGVPQKAAWRGSNFCFKRKQRKAKTNGWNLKMRVFLKGISFFQGSIFSQVGTGSFLQGVISSRHFTAPHTDQMW